MKIKYRESDGEILLIGAMPEMVAGEGEIVEDFEGEIPKERIDFFKRVSLGKIEEKSKAEKDDILDRNKRFTKAKVKSYVNAGATQAEKFDRLLKVVAILAQQVKESDV